MPRRPVGTCSRCGKAPRSRRDQWVILLPSAETPIAVVTICTACLRALTVWLGASKE